MAKVKITETGREQNINEGKDGKTRKREEEERECKMGWKINKRGHKSHETSS